VDRRRRTPVHVDQVGSRAVPPLAIRAKVPGFEALQQWFEIVRAHEIGQWDQSARTMASTDPTRVLAYIGNDLRMVRQLIEAAAVSRTTRISSPNNGKLLSLKSLPRSWGLTDDELDLPGDLTLLGDPENPVRKVDRPHHDSGCRPSYARRNGTGRRLRRPSAGRCRRLPDPCGFWSSRARFAFRMANR
jgi:hypothetical protein